MTDSVPDTPPVARRVRTPRAPAAAPEAAPEFAAATACTPPGRVAYDSLRDRPTGYVVVGTDGIEAARFAPHLEVAKRCFDTTAFATGSELRRLPDGVPMARKPPPGRDDGPGFGGYGNLGPGVGLGF